MRIDEAYSTWSATYDHDHNRTRDLDAHVTRTLLVSELHPFRQYEGTQAHFTQGGVTTAVPAFVHHVSEFTEAARVQGLELEAVREWWHADDAGRPVPRGQRQATQTTPPVSAISTVAKNW